MIKRSICTLIVLIFIFSVSVYAMPEMGDAPLDPVFSLAISTDKDSYYAGRTVTVSVTVNGILPAKGLSFVLFRLWYDAAAVEPVIKDNDAASESFLKSSPDASQWECIAKLCDGYYEISALTSGGTDVTAKDDGSIRFEIEFKVLRSDAENAVFMIPHDSIKAYDYDIHGKLYGNGSLVTIGIEQAVFEVAEGMPAVIDGEYVYIKQQDAIISDLRTYFTCDIDVASSKGGAVKDSALIATGQVITALGSKYTVVLYGDVNGDGKVNISDYTVVKRVLQGIASIDTAYEKAAHVSMRDKISITDYTRIKRYIQGISPLLSE